MVTARTRRTLMLRGAARAGPSGSDAAIGLLVCGGQLERGRERGRGTLVRSRR